MNRIKARITHIATDSGCVLVSAECVFGTFFALIIEAFDCGLNDEILINFKENEVFLLDNAAPLGSFNAFKGRLLYYEKSPLFTRVCLLPLPPAESHSTQSFTKKGALEEQNQQIGQMGQSIYALIPSLKNLCLQEGEIYTWCVSSSHIILEDCGKWNSK